MQLANGNIERYDQGLMQNLSIPSSKKSKKGQAYCADEKLAENIMHLVS